MLTDKTDLRRIHIRKFADSLLLRVLTTKLTCRYEAAQGSFSITLPSERCSVLPKPTTVENIALWLADQIAKQTGTATHVYAYEGIDKGATAQASP